jgi:hypothetical protein
VPLRLAPAAAVAASWRACRAFASPASWRLCSVQKASRLAMRSAHWVSSRWMKRAYLSSRPRTLLGVKGGAARCGEREGK